MSVRGAEPFYKISSKDGLTGFAATQRDVLVIHNVLDERERREIDPQLMWSKKIGEGEEKSIRSFFAIPIHRASGLIGLIRGHRNVAGRNVSFTSADKERLTQVQFLLERVLEKDMLVLVRSTQAGLK